MGMHQYLLNLLSWILKQINHGQNQQECRALENQKEKTWMVNIKQVLVLKLMYLEETSMQIFLVVMHQLLLNLLSWMLKPVNYPVKPNRRDYHALVNQKEQIWMVNIKLMLM